MGSIDNHILAWQLTWSREMNLGLWRDNEIQTRFSWLFKVDYFSWLEINIFFLNTNFFHKKQKNSIFSGFLNHKNYRWFLVYLRQTTGTIGGLSHGGPSLDSFNDSTSNYSEKWERYTTNRNHIQSFEHLNMEQH